MIGIFILLLIAMLLVVKFCKKTLKIVLASIISLSALYCMIITVDMNRVNSLKKPIFAIPIFSNCFSMQTTTYQGLGYKVELIVDVTKIGEENRLCQVKMYMFNKCIAGAIK